MQFVKSITQMENIAAKHHNMSLGELQSKTTDEYVYLLNDALEHHEKIAKDNGRNKRR